MLYGEGSPWWHVCAIAVPEEPPGWHSCKADSSNSTHASHNLTSNVRLVCYLNSDLSRLLFVDGCKLNCSMEIFVSLII